MENKTFITADAERNISGNRAGKTILFYRESERKIKQSLRRWKKENLHFALQHSVVR